MSRPNGKSASARVAFCGLMAALGAALMLTGGLIPVLTYCSPLAAALFLIPVMEEYGSRRGWMVWLITALLSLLISPDRESAFFYLFLGYYPMVQRSLASRPRRTAFAAKLLFFSLAVGAMYGFLLLLFRGSADAQELRAAGWAAALGIWAVLVIIMVIYDRVLTLLIGVYRRRLRPGLKFLN